MRLPRLPNPALETRPRYNERDPRHLPDVRDRRDLPEVLREAAPTAPMLPEVREMLLAEERAAHPLLTIPGLDACPACNRPHGYLESDNIRTWLCEALRSEETITLVNGDLARRPRGYR